jgi:ATP-dependent protease ClpP protease subunit
MLAHPVRMSGTVLGAPQTYYQFNQMQERIIGFICRHAAIKKTRLEELMLAKDTMAKDLGTILVGEEAVNEGLISHVGSLGDAMLTLERMIAGKKTAQKGV